MTSKTRNCRLVQYAAGFLLCIATAHIWAQNATRADAEKDPVLKAMLAELDRNQQGLFLKDAARPYFIEFRVEDVVNFRVAASFGALTSRRESHVRLAFIRVHVGSYKLDNSHMHLTGPLAALLRRFGIGGDGTSVVEVLDDDPVALRYALWSGADTAYKLALVNFAKRREKLKSVQEPPQADDFAQEKPVIYLEPVKHLEFDRALWTKTIVEGSGLAVTDPDAKPFEAELQRSSGLIEADVHTQYLVNTEGTMVRKSRAEYHIETVYSAQAGDGMFVERSVPLRSRTAEGLGSPAHFLAASLTALKGMDELRTAPFVTEEYHGPVLLEGNASARFIETSFARAVEARAPGLGSQVRVSGPFASSYETRVLPDFLSVTDDPTQDSFAGKELAGAYAIDDEGVPAQKVDLVDHGKLVGFDIDREPVRGFPASNGHGRAGIRQAPVSRIGVLEVEATNGIEEDALVTKLLGMGKEQGLPYVYVVQSLGGTNIPRVMERVDVATGKRVLVRGGELADLDLRSLRDGVAAAGDKPYVYNTSGQVPISVIAPALLMEDITVKRASHSNAHLPYIPAPAQ